MSQLQHWFGFRGDQLGLLGGGVGGLPSPFVHLVVFVQHPVHG
jgi:hypothetical protein